MTRPEHRLSQMEGLIELLDLETVEENLFRGASTDPGWQRVFGGQVIAQALVATQRTVVPDRFVHSLHAYFMRPGDPALPIVYEVDRIRDGGSFTTRRAVAIQHGKPIFALSASFKIDEAGYEHQSRMPDVPMPEDLPDANAIYEQFLSRAPENVRRYWLRERPVEIRPVSLTHHISSEKLEPFQHVWVKANGQVPDHRATCAAVLAYVSDMTLLDTSLFPHGVTIFDPTIQGASLDHAMWFHSTPDFSDWLLYTQDSPFSGGATGFSRGAIYNRSGRLVASVAQEGLIRKRAID